MTQHQDPTPDQGIPDGNGGFIPLDVYCSEYKHVKGNFYIRRNYRKVLEPDIGYVNQPFYEFDVQGEEVEGKACIEGDFLCNGSGQLLDIHDKPGQFSFNSISREFGRATCGDQFTFTPRSAEYGSDDPSQNSGLEESMNIPLEVGKAHISLRAFVVYDDPDDFTGERTIVESKSCRECNIPGFTDTNFFGVESFLSHGMYTMPAGFACQEANGENADEEQGNSPFEDPLRLILKALSLMCSDDPNRQPHRIHICWEYLEHLNRELCEYEVNEDQNGNITVDWMPEECDLKTITVWMQSEAQINAYNEMAIALGQNTRFVKDPLTYQAGYVDAWPIDDLKDRICDLANAANDCLEDNTITYEDSTAIAKCVDDEMPSLAGLAAIYLTNGMDGLVEKFGEILNTCVCNQFD